MIDLRLDFSGLDEMVKFFGREEIRDQPAGRGTTIRQVPLNAVIREASLRGLERVLQFVVKRVRFNAPFNTGALRNSVTGLLGNVVVAGGDLFSQAANEDKGRPARVPSTERGVLTGRSVSLQKRNRLDARLAVTAPYAFEVHEFFAPAPGATRQSKVQDSTPEGGVGGKFVTRVIQSRTADINRIMVDSIHQALANLKLVTKGARGASIGPFLQRAVTKKGGPQLGDPDFDPASIGQKIAEVVREGATLEGASFGRAGGESSEL